MIHDAAVATFRTVLIKLKLEPVELFGRDDVPGIVRINARQSTILNLPTRPHAFLLEVVPTLEVLTVEQKLPTRGFFRGCKGVNLPAVGGAEKKGAGGS